MIEETVEKKLQLLVGDFEGRVREYLEQCRSAGAKLLLLEFLSIPGAQVTGTADPLKFDCLRKESLASSSSEPRMTGEAHSPELVWLEWWARHQVFDDAEKVRCCRIIPGFRVPNDDKDDSASKIDFALFWPRADGKGHIKIAVECDSEDGRRRGKPGSPDYDALEKRGWKVVHLRGAEVSENPVRVVEVLRDVAAEENMRVLREPRTGH
jgi:hypothetical protein